jgi:NTP pyrophosphatase (non-canonical NTP hydrolase)
VARTRNKNIALSIENYARKARETDRFINEEPTRHYTNLIFGYFGEIGGILSALKKVRRDWLPESEADAVGEEIGDALWYVVAAAEVCNVAPQKLGCACLTYLRERFGEAPKSAPRSLGFQELDGITALHRVSLRRTRDALLPELAEHAGKMTKLSLSDMLALSPTDRAARYGKLLGLLAMVSARFGLNFGELAQRNLEKIADRWPGKLRIYHELFDKEKAPHEQLPRQLEVEFIQRKVGSRLLVVQQIKGINVGDPLTDNIHKPDGYRFHDVFHLAYAVHLGWSPVIRALLKVKRKSDPQIDENEDGARAAIIEEGIATWIFNHAKRRKFFADIEEGRLEYALLKQVRAMVDGYEVDQSPLWQWECAILEGFRVFRLLKDNKGGIATLDLDVRKIDYKPSSPVTI